MEKSLYTKFQNTQSNVPPDQSHNNNNNPELSQGQASSLQPTLSQQASPKENAPSKVAHLRNLPQLNNNLKISSDEIECEIIKLGFRFGQIQEILLMPKSGQAFLQMDTIEAAKNFVESHRDNPPHIGSQNNHSRQTIYVQYSNHQELNVEENTQLQQRLRKRLEDARAGIFSSQVPKHVLGHPPTNAQGETFNFQSMQSELNTQKTNHINACETNNNNPTSLSNVSHIGDGDFNFQTTNSNSSLPSENRRVLHVVIEKEQYPVSIHQFYELFSRHGRVLRIVMFKKISENSHAHQKSSQQVLIEMADPTEAQTAHYKFNGQNIYDGCNIMRIDFSKLNELQVKSDNEQRWDYTRTPRPQTLSTSGWNVNRSQQHVNNMYTGSFNNGPPSGTYYSNGQYQFNVNMQPPNIYQHGLGDPRYGYDPRASQDSLRLNQMIPNGSTLNSYIDHTNIICATNLNEDKINPDDLFILFGVYGDVQRVKILFEKRDTALIEFSNNVQAAIAMKHLNGHTLYGRELKVRTSKFVRVNLPKEGAPGGDLTKDFTNHPLHRYRKERSKNYDNIYAPSDVLHLSNIPDNTPQERLTSLFTDLQCNVVQFKFFKDPKMALIKLGSIEEALYSLIKTHNHKMSANQHLRVSFSKGYLT